MTISRSWLPRLLCIGRDRQDNRGWPGWRQLLNDLDSMGCHGLTHLTWPRTDSGGCWWPVALHTCSGASWRWWWWSEGPWPHPLVGQFVIRQFFWASTCRGQFTKFRAPSFLHLENIQGSQNLMENWHRACHREWTCHKTHFRGHWGPSHAMNEFKELKKYAR